MTWDHEPRTKLPKISPTLLTVAATFCAGCVQQPIRVVSNYDSDRLKPISSVILLSRGGSRGVAVQFRVNTLLKACGIETTLDTRFGTVGMSSELVEPAVRVRADAVLAMDTLSDPSFPDGPLHYALRLRRPDGVTAWRATSKRVPILGIPNAPVDETMAATLVDRMTVDRMLPENCRQRAT